MLLFAHSSNVPELLLARVVPGVATGACTGAVTALIVDMQPNPKIGAWVAGGSSPFGLAIGAVLAGVLIQRAPSPLTLVYWVLLVSYVFLMGAMPFVPEQPLKRPGASIWQAVRPRFGVPQIVRPAFVGIIPALFAEWAPCGLYLSLGSSMIAHLLGAHDHMVIGLVLASFFVPAPIATVLSGHLTQDARMVLGIGALAVGVTLTLVAARVHSLARYAIASITAGSGFGITFASTIAAIPSAAPVGDRSQTFAMTFAMAYIAFSAPAVLVGIAAQIWTLKSTFFVYGILEILVIAAATVAARASTRRRA
ncbi:Major Facilitator Superfamily protein [Caballeronia catudaia]|uniref:Major Facilitator Superfamily protein n=1 Tax=Caballeronia catudaia TaxID=1777136 RepID=A0A158DGQ3_9BURK|nr:hypothetical protein [Caballeronia catudaia]SAK93812.1 Major Facilitator Superfamily protein [Caballeronia catudaia]